MPVTPHALAHIRLTVTDIERSRRFYDAVFGMPVAIEEPAGADAATREQYAFLYGGLLYRVGDAMLGLRPVAPSGDRFDEDRVGLDHLSLAVRDRAELERAARLLDELGVAHEPIKPIGHGAILEFRDPDNIALELFSPE